MEQYAQNAYNLRQAVIYEASPMLHKSVFTEIVGINARGYNLLHNIVDRDSFASLETLNSLFEAAIACECCQDKSRIEEFRSATYRPGLSAAAHALTVANATSLIVNVLMSYRADGRNVVTPTGASFVAVENWNHSVPRSCIETNDCDGLSLLGIGLIQSALKVTPEQLEDSRYEYLRSVRNVVFPHYQIALSVIGANAAEANSANSENAKTAGHAIAVLLPTMSLLRSLSKTIDKRIGKNGKVEHDVDQQDEITIRRFEALFPQSVIDQLPANEKSLLGSWNTARHEFLDIKAFAIEGTTPTRSEIYKTNPEKRKMDEEDARNDKRAFAMSAPNVFRSIKRLHVGGGASGSEHSFYSDLVEITFAPDFPLYTDALLRKKEAAASQYVLTPPVGVDYIDKAGCTPKDLVEERYGAIPLVRLGDMVARVVDFASKTSQMDVVPPREKKPLQLNASQSKTLAQSMEHIKELETILSDRAVGFEPQDNHHCVAYVCAFNTLVHNPRGVKQFVDSMKLVAVSGVVDKKIIPGLAQDTEHNEVGVFLHLDVYFSL